MNPFQWLALGSLTVILLREIWNGRRQAASEQRGRLLRVVFWCGAALAIAMPQLTQWAAQILGIARGADLVHYLSILVFMAAAFHLYAKNFALEQQLTELIRHQAIREAEFGERRTSGRRPA